MSNKVIINIIPVNLNIKQRNNPDWLFRQKLANQDLIKAQKSIYRDIKHNIPIDFTDEIILNLSISPITFKIKIDYSQIKNKKIVKLIKLYLTREMEKFISEWFKLV